MLGRILPTAAPCAVAKVAAAPCAVAQVAAALSALTPLVPAWAQEPGPPASAPALAEPMIEFEADTLAYDEAVETVTASGNVLLRRDAAWLTADLVGWNRTTGAVEASGNVRIDSGDGNVAVADRVELTDTLRDGAVENILLLLGDSGRIAAAGGVRENNVTTLDRAVYTPCKVVDERGCPQEPVWSLKAVRVVHDPGRGRVRYERARLEAFGIPVIALPRFSHPDSFDRNQSGLLAPELRYSRELGGEIAVPYFWSLAPHMDVTTTAHLYTDVPPVLGLEYRHLLPTGPIRFAGRATYARGQAEQPDGAIVDTPARFRGYLEGAGELRHGGGWRSTFSTRLTNDDNFPGRYQISLDTRLRSTYALERQEADRYVAVRGWAFQDLRAPGSAINNAVAIPLVDLRWRLPARPLGGGLLLQANSLGLVRRDGQSLARGVASLQWDRLFTSPLGHRLTLTALGRGDLYQVRDNEGVVDPLYAGRDGLRGRLIGLGAADLEWPFAGPFLGGTQTISPRLQFVASAASGNDALPNEDSRAIDLEESNLFALNRFPGFDRWEDGARLTWGLDWRWSRPRLAAYAQFGQSIRLGDRPNQFPEGTGLAGRVSDFVGRASLNIGGIVEVTQRLRVDKDSLAIRRNETDVAIGSRRTFVSVGYLKFNRNIALEDLADHEELRAGARVALGRYWAIFGSAVVDLTSTAEDPLTTNDGWQPIRHRLGVSYTDECFDIGLTWRRNYVDNPNARRGNTFLFTLALRGLG
jgi:LPS-assembly protein